MPMHRLHSRERAQLAVSLSSNFSALSSLRVYLRPLIPSFQSSGATTRSLAIRANGFSIKRGIAQPRVHDAKIPVIFLKNRGRSDKEGEIAFVKRGFARCYLFPNEFAVPATWENIDQYATSTTTSTKRDSAASDKQESIIPLPWINNIKLEFVLPTIETDETTLMDEISIYKILSVLSKNYELDLLPMSVELPGGLTKICNTGDYTVLLRIPYKTKTEEYSIIVQVVSEQQRIRSLEKERKMAEAEKERSVFTLPETAT
ncbi:ribosomal protein L9, N-terminal domain-containing protein [Cardiosporidium cionae]|uniref:Ribosomal protein L9, N-terminal domain-containing protein n=1 Tax=Cardiosporidium cionae TaxID=476202 RepID=A0ABQ7JDA5_9APIC|nr:ribosomal protein L9, N-terminal domain-containing protein [Cardiosporidium cionae]|eukprot:KAF8821979.1 ribosomal protein L9, N-terminal domain-containing protein [Cardiosporidium cionae]